MTAVARPALTEATWQQQVIDLAHALGWRHMHVRRSIGKGRTWVTATNVPWPDLTLWSERQQRLVFADRKGSMTIKVEVDKVGRDNGRVIVKVANEVKPPKSDPDAGLFYPSARGLSKDDPQQVRVDWETGELITPEGPEA